MPPSRVIVSPMIGRASRTMYGLILHRANFPAGGKIGNSRAAQDERENSDARLPPPQAQTVVGGALADGFNRAGAGGPGRLVKALVRQGLREDALVPAAGLALELDEAARRDREAGSA